MLSGKIEMAQVMQAAQWLIHAAQTECIASVSKLYAGSVHSTSASVPVADQDVGSFGLARCKASRPSLPFSHVAGSPSGLSEAAVKFCAATAGRVRRLPPYSTAFPFRASLRYLPLSSARTAASPFLCWY